jgi:hypothetical protein
MNVNDDNAKILDLLRPFAANWSGTLKRGDVVIPKDDLPNLVEQIVAVAKDIGGGGNEATDAEVFHVLREASRSASLQNQVATLRREFRIAKRQ